MPKFGIFGKKKDGKNEAEDSVPSGSGNEPSTDAPPPGKTQAKAAPTKPDPSTKPKHLPAATNARMQKLMEMRAQTQKDSQGRTKSLGVKEDKTKQLKNRGPKARKNSDTQKRHSMFPKDKELNKEKEKYDSSKTPLTEKSQGKKNKVQYRVKNEIFEIYDWYEPVRILGSGAYAVVCEAIDTRTGRKVAIKKNKGVFDHITDARRILREIKLLMHFDHQDIIELIGVVPPEPHEIDTYNDVYLVMPKVETTLAKVIRSKQTLTDRHFQFFIYQMLRGLKYMHSAGVIHRDLKPENILINGADCNVKITDFGLSRGVCKDEIEKPTEYVVTRWYRSPEVMCSAGFYDEKVDLWSVGCIFAELLLRRPLFPGQNYLDQLKIIFEVMGTPKDYDWIKTPEAKKWVKKLKPHSGKDLKSLFKNITDDALDLIRKMLLLDPNARISAVDSLSHPWLKDLHRPEDEPDGEHFETSFEFEQSIKTKFGVRHMMFDALAQYEVTLDQQFYRQQQEANNKDDNKDTK